MSKKLLYQEIMDYLEAKIQQQEFRPDDLLPSEFELARQFNVSRITTQKALDELQNNGLIYRIRGKGSFVSEPSKSKANQFDQSLKIIALVIPFQNSFGGSLEVIQGLSPVLSKSGYYLTVHISHYSIEEERQLLNNLVNDGATGIIIYPFSHRYNVDLVNRLLLNKYPIITIDKYYDVLPVSSVCSDNFNGSYQAASHLIQLGHRNIVFVSDRDLMSANSVSERYFGFCKALKDHDLSITDDNLICIDYHNNEKLFQAIINNDPDVDGLLEPFKIIISNSLMNKEKRFTAIHGVNDYLTIFFLKAALAMGIKVPDEMSFVGFDNIDYSAFFEIPLSTIEQDFKKIGEEAGNLMINRIANPDEEFKRVVLPVKMIIRKSTGFLEAAVNY
jgi:GntR family transcriptional regulator, arabinose operon transcriptional repressor